MNGITQMPKKIMDWLHGRGINDRVIEQFNLSWDEVREEIVIPVVDAEGKHLFNKYRRNPLATDDGPKYRYEKGGSLALYGAQFLKGIPQVFICEGELDVLVLYSRGWNAVSSTGGSMTFQEAWTPLFNDKVTHIIYDNDEAGYKGAFRAHAKVPNSKIVWLPDSVGEHGDVTDFFQKGGSLTDFDKLVEEATIYDMSLVPDDEITTKKRRKEVVKEYQARIDTAMEAALALRSDNKSDAHLQTHVKHYTVKVEQHQLLLKIPSRNKGVSHTPGDGNRIAKAKSIPINQYIEFNHQGFAKCKWHDDDNPSMYWYRAQNRVKCFSCGKLGDIIDLIQQLKGVGFKEALQILVPEKK